MTNSNAIANVKNLRYLVLYSTKYVKHVCPLNIISAQFFSCQKGTPTHSSTPKGCGTIVRACEMPFSTASEARRLHKRLYFGFDNNDKKILKTRRIPIIACAPSCSK